MPSTVTARAALPPKSLPISRAPGLLPTMHTPGLKDTSLEWLARVAHPEDAPAWDTFAHHYGRLIRTFAVRSGLTEHEAQDLTQEMLLEVARHLQKGEYRRAQGSLRGWLFWLARWHIRRTCPSNRA